MAINWGQIEERFKNSDRSIDLQRKEYFVLRYKQSYKSRKIKPYGIPDNNVICQIPDGDILPYLLNDDEFFRAAYCNLQDGDEMLKVHLWDASGTDPEQLDMVIRSLTIWLGNDGLGKNWDIKCDHIEDVPDQLEQMGVENSNQRIAYGFAASYLRHRLTEHHFIGTSTDLPFLRGMRAYLEHIHEVAPELIKDILLHTSGMLPSIPESHVATSPEGLQRALIDKLGIFYIYYNVAGAGKTAQIFKLLSKRWGIYAISPNVPIEDSTTASHSNEHPVLGEYRSSCSRDTFTLYSDVESVSQTLGKHLRKVFATGRLIQTFLRARCELLEIFRSLGDSSSGRPSPLRWLQLQVSCVTQAQDPCDMTYRLLRLLVMTRRDVSLYLGPDSAKHASDDLPTEQEGSHRQQQSSVGERYFCWDEMQTALTSETSRDILHSICRLLLAISDETRDLTNWLSPITYRHVILSGTSLNVQNMVHFFQEMVDFEKRVKKASRNTSEEEAPLREPRLLLSLSTTTQMPYISDSEQFWSFYKTYISSIITELAAQRPNNREARVSQIPLLARSGRPLPFEIPIERLLRQENWWSRPLGAASKDQMLNFVTRWFLTHCPNQESADKFGEKLREVQFSQENDSLQYFDFLDRPTDEIDKNIRRIVAGRKVKDVKALLPFLYVISRLYQKSQKDFVQALTTGLCKSNADPEFDLAKGVQGLRDHCVRYLVDHYAKPFRGRYRWSAFFVEELMNGTSGHGGNVSSVRKVSQAAHDTVWSRICNALQERLSQLAASQQHKDLVSHLLKMAWRAYLLRVPSICKNERAVELVREGFARTTQKSRGAVLDESLAVHAVMQFLRQNSQYYQEEMHDEMNPSQLDRESLSLTGKMHELSIAMTFDQLLRPSEHQYMMESQDEYDARKKRRQRLFSILSSASANRNWRESPAPLSETGLKGYKLREGGEVIDDRATENIWNWLSDENRSTFLFPQNIAHPDLMFILERKRENSDDSDGPRTDRIICALQSKLGEIDNYFAQVAHLRPDKWYTTKTQTDTAAEFQDFAKETFLLILSGAGGKPKGSAFTNAINQRGEHGPGNFYFCYMSPDEVKPIFLGRYERFLKQLRSKKNKS